MKLLNLLIFTVIILFYSCSVEDETNNPSGASTILLKETKNISKFSNLFSQIRYLQLETNSQALIGNIRKIQISDTLIYILDQEGQFSNIKIFSVSGKFLGFVGKTGRGAKEIFRPRDFFINQEILYVWDAKGVHSFSKDGNYNEFLFDAHFVGQSFFYESDNFYFLHELNKPAYLSKYNKTGKELAVYIPFDFWLGSFGDSRIISLKNNKFNIFSPVMDTIFSYQNNELIPEYYIECDIAKTIEKIFIENKALSPPELSKKLNKTPSASIINYLENDNYIYISYMIKRKKFALLINKTTWNELYFSKYLNDIDRSPWGKAILLTNDNELVVPLYSYDLLTYFKKNKIKPESSVLAQYISKTSLNDNPILMFCKLKF